MARLLFSFLFLLLIGGGNSLVSAQQQVSGIVSSSETVVPTSTSWTIVSTAPWYDSHLSIKKVIWATAPFDFIIFFFETQHLVK